MCDTFLSKTVVLQLPKFMNELHCASAARCGIILFVWNACAPRAADIPNFVYIFFCPFVGPYDASFSFPYDVRSRCSTIRCVSVCNQSITRHIAVILCAQRLCMFLHVLSSVNDSHSTIHTVASRRHTDTLNTHETYPPTNQPANHPPTELTNKRKISACLTCESNLYTAAARSLWHTFYRNFCHFISAINFSAPYTLGSVRFWIASK